MRKKYIFGKKLYISILTSILVLLTTLATTFAWVGVFANSTFEMFEFNIKASDLIEYGIEISATGEEGTFSDTIDSKDIKKQILLNWGYSNEDLYSNDIIDTLFQKLSLAQCTNLPILNGTKIKKLGTFVDLYGDETKEYFKFDIYVGVRKNYDGQISNYKLNTYVGDGLLIGTAKSRLLLNPYTFKDDFVNPLLSVSLPENITPVVAGTRIDKPKVNSASGSRIAFEKYKVVDRGHASEYTDSDEPLSAIIYSGDKYNYPTYNTLTNTYEFGGILPDEYNLSTAYFNSSEWKWALHGLNHLELPDDLNSIRGVESETADKILSSQTNQIIDSSNPNEQIGVTQMMKITVSFWIEGWDADCFTVLNNSPIRININLSTVNEDVF